MGSCDEPGVGSYDVGTFGLGGHDGGFGRAVGVDGLDPDDVAAFGAEARD